MVHINGSEVTPSPLCYKNATFVSNDPDAEQRPSEYSYGDMMQHKCSKQLQSK